jgi:2-oxoisovalerate dehydrogenase E1 component
MRRRSEIPERHPQAAAHDVGVERLIALYRAMLLPRVIEEKMARMIRQGRLSKWFSGIGQEAISAGVVCSVRQDDILFPAHRNLGVFAARVDLLTLFRQLLGKAEGFTNGRDRTFHFGVPAANVVGMISHMCAMLPVADGCALAQQLDGTGRIAVAFAGDGASSEGDFHEALNLAAVWKLPVLFVLENNRYSISTPSSQQYAAATLADRAVGYGMPGIAADGNDVVEVSRVVADSAARARNGGGPTLIELHTFRMRGHEEASGAKYVPDEVLAEWAGKDPIARHERLLLERGALDEAGQRDLRQSLVQVVDRLVDEAEQTPLPASTPERELQDVFFVNDALPTADAGDAEIEMRYVDAVRDALRVGMQRNPRTLLLGLDIAEYGGVFKATEGLLAEFGRDRVRNTPTMESGPLGAALGLALYGFVPIVEIQYADFLTCGFTQIVENIAKTRYRWGGPIRVVIRAPTGGSVTGGPFHSQNVEAWFANVAGLKIVAPATARDAKGLLLAALEDHNPVLCLEHKFLYRTVAERVPSGHFIVPIGRARIARPGRTASIVTYGVGVPWALDAAATFAEEGIDLEVIDLRSLIPWDVETVLASVRRTNRALVLHEAQLTGGFGGEIASTIGQLAFNDLDAPVARVGGLDTPVPFAKPLEEIFSAKSRLTQAIRDLVAY